MSERPQRELPSLQVSPSAWVKESATEPVSRTRRQVVCWLPRAPVEVLLKVGSLVRPKALVLVKLVVWATGIASVN